MKCSTFEQHIQTAGIQTAHTIPAIELELSEAVNTLTIKLTWLMLHFKLLSYLTLTMEHKFILILEKEGDHTFDDMSE